MQGGGCRATRSVLQVQRVSAMLRRSCRPLRGRSAWRRRARHSNNGAANGLFGEQDAQGAGEKRDRWLPSKSTTIAGPPITRHAVVVVRGAGVACSAMRAAAAVMVRQPLKCDQISTESVPS